MSDILAVTVFPDGRTERHIKALGLDRLQGIVDGWIEHVAASDLAGVFINEEGKLEGLEHNQPATEAFNALGGRLFAGDYLAGIAIFVGTTDAQGETISLTTADADRVEVVAHNWIGRQLVTW